MAAMRAAEASGATLASAVQASSADAVQRIRSHLSVPALAQFSDFVADRAKGSYIWTTDGQRHLDMATGIGVVSTGHCHPHVVKAIQEQASEVILAQQNIFTASKPMVRVLDRLLEVTPRGLTRFFFANSGSEVVENAVKIARAYTGKNNIIAFENSFHGRTFASMALTNSKTYYRAGFGGLLGGTFATQYPYCLHCKTRQAASGGSDWYKIRPNVPPFGDAYEARTCCNGPLESLHWLLKQQSAPSDTAAIIIEPIMGEGGFLTPPPGFLQSLRKICDQHNIMLIMDEVQSGVGRTGKWWAHQHLMEGEPDMLLFAKGIASGFPFAGLATKDDAFAKLAPGTLGGTYGSSSLGCAAAAATLEAIAADGMLDNALQRGRQLVEGLVALAKRGFPISDIRGRGLMVAMEFGGKDGGLTAEPGTAAAVTKAAGKHNMLLLTAGARETVRFLPPLNVSEAEIAEALGILEASLEDVFGKP